jgi:hypothetical protein
MSNKKNLLSLSDIDTDNNSIDSTMQVNISKTKKTYNKKNTLSEKDLEQLNFINKFKEFEKELDAQYDSIKKLRAFAKEIKTIYNQDMIKIRKIKRTKENSSVTGFNKKFKLPDKLCELVSIQKGTEITTPEFAAMVYAELKKRGLQYTEDKRVYRADKQFLEVFNLKESVNKSTKYPDENGFNIGTMQHYISESIKRYKNEELEKEFNKNQIDEESIKKEKKIKLKK